MHMQFKTKVDTYQPFKYHWLVWKFLGTQPPKPESKWYTPYMAYGIILNLSILSFSISQIINLIFSANMSELCENICNTTSVLICIFKWFNILVMRHKLVKVSSILKQLDARAKAEKEVKILEEGIAAVRKLAFVFGILCLAFFVCCRMIVYLAGERMLVLPSWYPWDWKSSNRNFLFAHFYESHSVFCHGLIDFTCDTFPPTCLIILSAHIKALASRIQHLGVDNASSEDTLYKELTECIKDHNNLFRLFQNIHETISFACLGQFVATGLSQCTLGVYMIYVRNNPSKLLQIFLYYAAITTEIFLLCFFGDFYCQANAHLTESIYANNWMDRDVKFKKSFLLLLQRSQKPSTVVAGNLIPVQMPTFVKIIKTAYSVFTVLNNAN